MTKSTEEFSKLSIEESLVELQTEKGKGLSPGEAAKRLDLYGYNEIPEKSESMFHRIARRFWGPIPWMIEAAALLSALVGKWEDFTIIMILLCTNVIIDFWQESKVLKEKLAKNALVLREGKYLTIDARSLVCGERFHQGMDIPVPAQGTDHCLTFPALRFAGFLGRTFQQGVK